MSTGLGGQEAAALQDWRLEGGASRLAGGGRLPDNTGSSRGRGRGRGRGLAPRGHVARRRGRGGAALARGPGGHGRKMAALQEARAYGLSCGRVGAGGRLSVLHVKLTDSALRAFETYCASQDSLARRPSIRFQGSQGHICVPQPNDPEPRTFSFYVSSAGRDGPQGSFDCVRHGSSRGAEQLTLLGAIQDKLTVCATDESYQKARLSLAQAEEETRSRAAIVIKPGGRYLGRRVQLRRPAPGASEAVPTRKRLAPLNPASASVRRNLDPVAQRPLRERVLHLLALRPYRKAELLLRLRRDGLTAGQEDALEPLLCQVANVSVRDSTWTLKESTYREVQRDWPGYSEGDQGLLRRLLERKLCQTQAAGVPAESVGASFPREGDCSDSPLQKPVTPEPADQLAAKKRQRVSHLLPGPLGPPNGKLSDAPAPATHGPAAPPPPRLEPRAHDPLADLSNDLGRDPAAPALADGAPHTPCTKTCKRPKRAHKSRGDPAHPRDATPPLPEPLEPTPDVLGLPRAYTTSAAPTSTSETPDYQLKYSPIASAEQRQRYKNDFNAEYAEYRQLHARIEQVTRRFTQLDGRLRQLEQGSAEYETTRGQILQEYRKIKKTHRGYSEEKLRCQYLHGKLALIKRRIADFDQHQLRAAPQ